MDNQQPGSKRKIIAACVVIAAIAILYVVSAARTQNNETTRTTADDTAITQSENTDTGASTDGAAYVNGTYKASGSYRTPESTESIDVSLTIQNGMVTESSVQQTPQDSQSAEYQAEFKNNYKQLVVGKKLDEINLSRVSGSSLTSGGFNNALEEIKSQARAKS